MGSKGVFNKDRNGSKSGMFFGERKQSKEGMFLNSAESKDSSPDPEGSTDANEAVKEANVRESAKPQVTPALSAENAGDRLTSTGKSVLEGAGRAAKAGGKELVNLTDKGLKWMEGASDKEKAALLVGGGLGTGIAAKGVLGIAAKAATPAPGALTKLVGAFKKLRGK